MSFEILLISVLLSFIVTYIATPKLIKYLKRINLVVKDMNKKDTPLVPLSGGLAVFSGFFIGITFYIFIQTFIYKDSTNLIELFAAITTITIITLIGFVDDLLIRKDKETSAGLKQWQKPLLTLVAAIPLMVINVSTTKMDLPFIGLTEFGIFFPLVLIPLGIVGAANMVNMLAGFNGSETGMGIIFSGMLGLYAYTHQSDIATVLSFIIFGTLLAFYYFNKYPAKILPGDSLTYLLGASLASIAILGDLNRAALIVSIPFIIEFFLKLRSKFKADSYGYYKDGKVQSKYKKIYSIPHILTRTGKYTEKQVTLFMILIELAFASLIWFV